VAFAAFLRHAKGAYLMCSFLCLFVCVCAFVYVCMYVYLYCILASIKGAYHIFVCVPYTCVWEPFRGAKVRARTLTHMHMMQAHLLWCQNVHTHAHARTTKCTGTFALCRNARNKASLTRCLPQLHVCVLQLGVAQKVPTAFCVYVCCN
jgi:hypothetical protein